MLISADNLCLVSDLGNIAPSSQFAESKTESKNTHQCIAETLMARLQSFGILRSKLVAPQTNRFIANNNSPLCHQIFDISMAEVKSMIEPHGILNYLCRKPVAFV